MGSIAAATRLCLKGFSEMRTPLEEDLYPDMIYAGGTVFRLSEGTGSTAVSCKEKMI